MFTVYGPDLMALHLRRWLRLFPYGHGSGHGYGLMDVAVPKPNPIPDY